MSTNDGLDIELRFYVGHDLMTVDKALEVQAVCESIDLQILIGTIEKEKLCRFYRIQRSLYRKCLYIISERMNKPNYDISFMDCLRQRVDDIFVHLEILFPDHNQERP